MLGFLCFRMSPNISDVDFLPQCFLTGPQGRLTGAAWPSRSRRHRLADGFPGLLSGLRLTVHIALEVGGAGAMSAVEQPPGPDSFYAVTPTGSFGNSCIHAGPTPEAGQFLPFQAYCPMSGT